MTMTVLICLNLCALLAVLTAAAINTWRDVLRY